MILLEENRNYAGGNNAGARAARGEVLVLLNNDTEVAGRASLDALAAAGASSPASGSPAAACSIRTARSSTAGARGGAAPTGSCATFHLFRHEAGDLPAACATFDCDILTGACLAVRRDLFEELSGFDETFVNGWEDTDLCVRARLAGHRVVYRGDLAIVHAEGHDARRTRATRARTSACSRRAGATWSRRTPSAWRRSSTSPGRTWGRSPIPRTFRSGRIVRRRRGHRAGAGIG